MITEASHVVVIGGNSTAQRLVGELSRAGETVVMIVPLNGDPDLVLDMERLGAEVIQVRRVGEAALVDARIDRARAAVIFGDDDVEMIRTALAVEELSPETRLILELGNPRLGKRLPALLGDVTVMSSAELAAPSFVSAALATDDVTTFELAGRLVVAGPLARVGGERLAGLADTSRSGPDGLLPVRDADVVLGTKLVGDGGPRVPIRRSGLRGVVSHVFDSKARWVVVGVVVLIVVSVLYFRATGLDWLTAFFYALTASTATGGPGDYSELPVIWRIGAVVIALFGLVLSSGVTAVILDVLISSRLSALTGGVRGKPRDHVIVIGLGRVGMSVVSRLVERDVPVVAIELDEDAVGVRRARRLKVPVVIAEGSDVTALETAGVAEAAAVLAVTDDDGANLEIGLAAKDAHPDVRVVTRLFDHDLADRVERRVALGATRSVSVLAAPAFAAAAGGRPKEMTFPVGRRVLSFTELEVPADSPAVGLQLRELAVPGQLTVLAIRSGDRSWSWERTQLAPERVLAAGDTVALVASRTGLSGVLQLINHGIEDRVLDE
ncbi:NAD-binding protein [Microlunatus sp. Y2014]|uniref:NAD-binding protein n=1 Tax=Microlunatus sp. Y2014 TaxID=3418488 RepID=UPI003DA74E36